MSDYSASAAAVRGCQVVGAVVEVDMLLDAHTHVQPDAAGTAELYRWLGTKDRARRGDVDELMEHQAVSSVGMSLIVPWLPAQQLVDEAVDAGLDRETASTAVVARWRELNRWAWSCSARAAGRFRALVGVDPIVFGDRETRAEIAAAAAAGAVGIKIAPMFLRTAPNDPRLDVVWRAARDHSMFVLSEAGDYSALGRGSFGHPDHFRDVVAAYSDVRVVLAHLAMNAEDSLVELTRRFGNVYTDLSSRFDERWQVRPEELVALIRRIGTDRVMFGSNYPMSDLRSAATAFRNLGLRRDEQHCIGYANAATLWGLDRQT